jgi:hypothetical protein
LRVARDARDRETISVNGQDVARYLVVHVAVNGLGVYRARYDRSKGDAADAVAWEQRLSMPDPALGNAFGWVTLALCRNRPEVLYAVLENRPGAGNAGHMHASSVYASSDHGDHWQQRGTIPRGYLLDDDVAAVPPTADGQANYDLVLEVNPDDPDILVCGEVDLNRSEDGGRTWVPVMTWQVYDDGDYAQHGDQHAVLFDAADRKRVWAGHDGGVSLARDLHGEPAARGFWRRRSAAIVAGQFQDVTVHPNPAFSFVGGGGLQDNGVWVGFGGPTWYHIGGGDGGMMAVHATDVRRYLSGAQFDNEMAAVTAGPTGSFENPVAHDVPAPANSMFVTRFGHPAPGFPNSGPFVPVQEQDPLVPGQMLVGWTMAAGQTPAYWTAPPGAAAAGAVNAIALPAPAVTVAEEASAVAFGPAAGAPPTQTGWIGLTDGRVFSSNAAPAGAWAESVTFPRTTGRLRQIARIATHPISQTMVAVASNPAQRALQIVVTTAGAPGVAQFTVQLIDRTFNNWAVAGAPIVTPAAGACIAAPGSDKWLRFAAGPYAVGDTWIVQTDGTVNPQPPATAAGLAVVVATEQTLTLRITTAGAVGVARFTAAVGAFVPTAPFATGAAVEIPGAELVVGFAGGPFAVGDQWSVAPDDTVVAAGAPGGSLRVVARLQGRVHLSYDGGASWADITAPTAAPAAPADPRSASLPPCAIASLRFDLDPATNALSLFAGTLAGVYVLRNLPAPPAMPAPIPVVNPAWRPFNGTAAGRLPLTLVSDIEALTVPQAAPASARRLLRIATFGRGIWDCDLGGGPQFQPYIRQTLVEDGRRYPRTIPPTAAPGFAGADSDYRLPAGTVGYDFTHAFDIRVDAAPLEFFDDRVDGVEFDEELGADALVPLARNAVYVQVHNAGWDTLGPVTVQLYFAPSAAAPYGPPPGSPIPAGLPPVADFYDQPNFDPPAASALQRVGPPQTIPRLAPEQPQAVRFDWTPPAALAGGNVALLAVCSAPQSPLPTPRPATIATVADLVTNEPRAALRIVPVGPIPAPLIFVRDGVDDDARLGAVAFAGRSSDLIVVPAVPAQPPEQAFRDLLELRPQDRLVAGANNHVYVRVHNRGPIAVNVEVHLFAAALDSTNTPAFAPNGWTRLTPDPANPAPPPLQVPVPAGGVGYALQTWANPPDPNAADAIKAYGLIALIRNADSGEALPDTGRVTSLETFWQLFREFFDAGHAALRVLRYQ